MNLQVFIFGRTVQYIRANLVRVKEMATVYGNLLKIQMHKYMKETIKMIRKVALEFINGLMDLTMKVISKRIKNMVQAKQDTKMANKLYQNGKAEEV